MKRVKRTFTQDEKDLIFRLWKQGTGFSDIGRVLQAAPGTVFTALRESGGIKPKPRTRNKQHLTLAEREEIRVALSAKKSLREIAARVEYRCNPFMHVSHETIYKSIYVRSKAIIHFSFSQHLRRSHPMRHSRYHRRSGDRTFTTIVNGLSIRDRDEDIETRASIGHWEGDLVSGSKNTHIATLVDRKARYTILLKLAGKDAESVYRALLKTFKQMPAEYRKSLTWDRGMELAKHAELTKEIGIPVYFCDPQSPWQRGTNENTNSLVRQYFPRKTDLSIHSQELLNNVATQLNERPRKVLNFMTPSNMIDKGVALIT